MTIEFNIIFAYFKTTGGNQNNTMEFPLAKKYAHGAWFYQQPYHNITYLVDGERNKPLQPNDKSIEFRVYRCFFEKCVVPTPPPAPKGRPATGVRKWSVKDDWEGSQEGYGCTYIFITSIHKVASA